MSELKLYYATNRNHIGKDRWHPSAYGAKFSADGIENLRFGVLSVTADDARLRRFLTAQLGTCGTGDGESLAGYLATCARKATIVAYEERIDPAIADAAQQDAVYGSSAMFADLKADMLASTDVMLYIHGFNVSWFEAVGGALAAQCMLRNAPQSEPTQQLNVVLFTWPSDGMALPLVSYKSDRSEAAGSGAAIGRGFLKVRDFLAALRDRAKTGAPLCGQDIHLLCHSMGNYLLQHALKRVVQFTPGTALPRLFEHIFLCAPDVDDTVLEPAQPLVRVHEIARTVTIYFNRHDAAMVVSDYTKGNPERLGGTGAARPALLHNKIHQVDCTPIVSGVVQHSYYLAGNISHDIRASMDGWTQNDPRRKRLRDANLNNVWTMLA